MSLDSGKLEIAQWIRSMVQHEWSGPGINSVLSDLRNGQILCDLANKIQPNSIKRVHRDEGPFFVVLNINAFLRWAKECGLKPHQLFQESDLKDRRDPEAVFACLEALFRHFKGCSANSENSSGSGAKIYRSNELRDAHSLGMSANESGMETPGSHPRAKKKNSSSKLSEFMQAHPIAQYTDFDKDHLLSAVDQRQSALSDHIHSKVSSERQFTSVSEQQDTKAAPLLHDASLFPAGRGLSAKTIDSESLLERFPTKEPQDSLCHKTQAPPSKVPSSSAASSPITKTLDVKQDPEVADEDTKITSSALGSREDVSSDRTQCEVPGQKSRLAAFMSSLPSNTLCIAAVHAEYSEEERLPQASALPGNEERITSEELSTYPAETHAQEAAENQDFRVDDKQSSNVTFSPRSPIPPYSSTNLEPPLQLNSSPPTKHRSFNVARSGTMEQVNLPPRIGDSLHEENFLNSYNGAGDKQLLRQNSGQYPKLAELFGGKSGLRYGTMDWYSLYVAPGSKAQPANSEHDPSQELAGRRSSLQVDEHEVRLSVLEHENKALKDENQQLVDVIMELHDRLVALETRTVDAREQSALLREEFSHALEHLTAQDERIEANVLQTLDIVNEQSEQILALEGRCQKAETRKDTSKGSETSYPEATMSQQAAMVVELQKSYHVIDSAQRKLQQQLNSLQADIAEKDVEMHALRAKVQQLHDSPARMSTANMSVNERKSIGNRAVLHRKSIGRDDVGSPVTYDISRSLPHNPDDSSNKIEPESEKVLTIYPSASLNLPIAEETRSRPQSASKGSTTVSSRLAAFMASVGTPPQAQE